MAINEFKLDKRASGIRDWLIANHPECEKEQAHLKEGTPERAYWHFGYYMALEDVLNLTTREALQSVTESTHNSGKCN